ncbi:NifB/NifX family molybdenum-iron cluster-binding protein [Nitratiruptor sp. SB155-2]|uniref:NifB/NifX family molybdenum-iron cluster-binding protein n=1 Tax=Nitratiruptor sp. (strain SB155-2) TaxID=387092 RepID=UPI0001586F39|nr:NifB/NifX family molybdenum-iron cluster-binding protein [Nitratiruptor sp. SB155-2]BAF69260.1 conserved hypothetical protein [Nitratiruptor sp. SB155-2]
MKVAIPVKMNKKDSAISPLFGHAKWFAFIENGNITIKQNPHDGGVQVVEWLLDEGIDVVITQHIGLKPFTLLQKMDVDVYYPGDSRITIDEAMQCFNQNRCEKITFDSIEKFARHKH